MLELIAIFGLTIGFILVLVIWKVLSTHQNHLNEDEFTKQMIKARVEAAQRIIKERCK